MNKRLEPDPDLEHLIRRLNAEAQTGQPEGASAESVDEPKRAAATPGRWPLPQPRDESREWLEGLLEKARNAGASDLLLVAGAPPAVRVHGSLGRLTQRPLSPEDTGRLCAALVPDDRREPAEQAGAVDFAFDRPRLGRFRCNVHRERRRWSAAIRLFPDSAPDLDALHLPSNLGRFAELDHGLVLVTGPTGCGKSTTLAALMRRILSTRNVHLVTIEDPVEYEHVHDRGVAEHIEIGRDVPTFAAALRSALRQDPDVLLIGEMRDTASMSIAITAAETGHLVFSTLHTGDSPQTIHRILDSYPPQQIDAVRAQLSSSLAGIISQQLIPGADGISRYPAVEILLASPAVRNLIRQGKIEQLRSQLTLERQAGSLDLDRSLALLTKDGLVENAEARLRARHPAEFDSLLRAWGA